LRSLLIVSTPKSESRVYKKTKNIYSQDDTVNPPYTHSKEPYKRDYILQKRPRVLSLLIIATPLPESRVYQKKKPILAKYHCNPTLLALKRAL